MSIEATMQLTAENFMENICHHPDISCVTNMENERVCTICGLVVQIVYQPENDVITVVDIQTDFKHETEKKQEEIRELMKNIFENAHIPMCIFEMVINYYGKLKKVLFEDQQISFKNRELLCYATYIIMIEEKIPRSPPELSHYFEVNPYCIWRVEKHMNNSPEISPYDLVERFSFELKVPFKNNPAISTTIRMLSLLSSAKPQTIAGCAFYIFGKEVGLSHLKLSRISKTCGVSISSIKNLYKKYQKSQLDQLNNDV